MYVCVFPYVHHPLLTVGYPGLIWDWDGLQALNLSLSLYSNHSYPSIGQGRLSLISNNSTDVTISVASEYSQKESVKYATTLWMF